MQKVGGEQSLTGLERPRNERKPGNERKFLVIKVKREVREMTALVHMD